jgi:hypothetical protein
MWRCRFVWLLGGYQLEGSKRGVPVYFCGAEPIPPGSQGHPPAAVAASGSPRSPDGSGHGHDPPVFPLFPAERPRSVRANTITTPPHNTTTNHNTT